MPETPEQNPEQAPEQAPGEAAPDEAAPDEAARQAGDPANGPVGALDTDPALVAAVLEIEAHLAGSGWDQPARLYALVDTAELARREPALAAAMGLDDASAAGSLTPVEQEQLPQGSLEKALEQISWPGDVQGCAAVVERLVLPPAADAEVPQDPSAAEIFAREHPDRQEVRIVAGVTRGGSSYCALRLKAHDDDQSVVGGVDLVPGLVQLLQATLDAGPDPASSTTMFEENR